MSSPELVPHPVSIEEISDPDIHTLARSLTHTGELIQEAVPVPGSNHVVRVIRPRDIDTLLDQVAGDPEQNLPYWAEIWPSGIALAGALLREPGRISGQPVLELGSGVGLTAAIALQAGSHLTATDYAPESLVLTRLTCRLHVGREPETRQVNWRSPDADLLQADGSRWPVILAADVLYEDRDIDPLLEVFERIVAPGGLVWLAEPGRRPAKLALQRAIERQWSIESSSWTSDWTDPEEAGLIVQVHRMHRPSRTEALTTRPPDQYKQFSTS